MNMRAGMGGMPPRPLNAPAGQQAAGGVQPGASNPVLLALFVLIFGPNNGLFEYSGAPALGNLEASITQASQDPRANTTYPGIASYQPNGTATPSSVVQLNAGQLNMGSGSQFAGTGGASPAAVTVTSAPGSGSELSLNSGLDASTDSPAFLNVFSKDAAGGLGIGYLQGSGPLQLLAVGPISSQQCLYSSVNGTPSAQDDHGLAGSLPIVQTDTSTNTNANQVAATRISAIWTVPANDAQAGTIYELEVPFDALFEGVNVNVGLSIDGSASFTIGSNISGTIVTAGNSPNGTIGIKVQILTTGAGGTFNAFIDGTLTLNGTPITFSTTTGFAANTRAKGVAIDTTVSHTFRVNALWGGANVGQTISGYGSKFTRSGP